MSDYPDPDEEYELMYADELDLMRQAEEHSGENVVKKKTAQAKRSLDFSSPVPNKTVQTQPTTCNLSQPDTITNSQEIQLSGNLQALENVFEPVNGSQKRSVEELFGDIGDLDFDNVELPNKRQKTEEETDMELINKIIEERKLRQMLSEPIARSQAQGTPYYDIKENLSLNIPRWNFMPLTNSEGDRIYVRLESEENWDHMLEQTNAARSLHTSYIEVWEEARKILDKKLEEANRPSQQNEELPDIDTENLSDDALLWVDRYKPRSYIDLLSEEPINRAVLHWLHLWDKIVFKKEVKVNEPQQRNSFSKRTGQFQLTNTWKGKKVEAEPELDEDGRPHHKVVLLCGPPGVGKTTLAHLLAKLAGYRPVELNASDERSADAFGSALRGATLMRAVLDAERRPNCLILDEIDGAPLPTVELLVKWCTASIGGGEGGKKKGKAHALRRPIIAIANDLYTPALRPLRAVALVVAVGGAGRARLQARLAAVAARERLSAAPHVLAALAARARGDVRAALSVLHFVKTGLRRQLQMEDVMKANIGEKDCNKGLMQALRAIFTTNDEPDPFGAVLKIIHAAGDYDRICDGIFEHYLRGRTDARLVRARAALRWLAAQDAAAAWTARRQDYRLLGARAHYAAACHAPLAARPPAPYLAYPTQAQEVYRKTQDLEAIVGAVYRDSSPGVGTRMRRALRLDVLSLLPYILSPTLRSANIQLCSESERGALRAAAGAMCDYGLAYAPRRAPDGLLALALEPDVYRVAFYGNEERMRPQPALRQAISREQQSEQIRRLEAQTTKVNEGGAAKKSSEKPREPAPEVNAGGGKESSLPNHLQRLKPKAINKSTPQVQKDFFGRLVPITERVQRTNDNRDLISSSSVFYQYREGFNNAVRRSVRMRDLL